MESTQFKVQSDPVKVVHDKGRAWRARIAFVLIATDGEIEKDMMMSVPDGVGVHFTRLPGSEDVTVENLMAMEKGLENAAARFVFDNDLSVVCFACTSASALIGEQRVNAALKKGAPVAKPTSLISGAIRALKAFEAVNIAVATPYLDSINDLEAQYLVKSGFNISSFQGMNILKDPDIRSVSPEFIKTYAKSVDRPDADAIFISCGALRTLDIIDDLEQQVQKPVVTSNQAMLWDTLRLAGINDKLDGFGRLLREF